MAIAGVKVSWRMVVVVTRTHIKMKPVPLDASLMKVKVTDVVLSAVRVRRVLRNRIAKTGQRMIGQAMMGCNAVPTTIPNVTSVSSHSMSKSSYGVSISSDVCALLPENGRAVYHQET